MVSSSSSREPGFFLPLPAPALIYTQHRNIYRHVILKLQNFLKARILCRRKVTLNLASDHISVLGMIVVRKTNCKPNAKWFGCQFFRHLRIYTKFPCSFVIMMFLKR